MDTVLKKFPLISNQKESQILSISLHNLDFSYNNGMSLKQVICFSQSTLQ